MKFTGADITHLRQSARVSKVRLSRVLGVNRRTIANWENEIGAPNTTPIIYAVIRAVKATVNPFAAKCWKRILKRC